MKRLIRFLFHLTTALIVAFAINALIRIQFAPLGWGYNGTYKRFNALTTDITTYNTVLFGSSRVGNQIDPIYFDQITNTTLKTNTYNTGSAGVGPMELYYLYSQILKEEDFKPTYILYEIFPAFEWSEGGNRFSIKDYYWRNLTITLKSIPIIWQNDNYTVGTLTERMLATAKFTTFTIKNMANVGTWRTVAELQEDIIFTDSRGYFPLLLPATINKRTHFAFQNEPNQYNNLVLALESYSKNNCKKHSTVVADFYLNILNMAEEKGVQLIFIHPSPGIHIANKCIMDLLPEHTYIEAPDIHEFPHMYEKRYIYDKGHFNYKGSQLFTNYVATEFMRKYHLSR